jgi:AmmeMemoRadiSam system protein B
MAVREPAVAGTFYPDNPDALRDFGISYLSSQSSPCPAKAVMLPHAGYIYSGETACSVLSKIKIPQTIFLIGPNHQSRGADFALFSNGEWKTPLGSVRIAADLAGALSQASPYIEEDHEAHLFEHSLEVEIPLLQMKNPDIQIVPLVIGTLDLERATKVARACATVLAKWPEPWLIVISSDMNHYEDDERTRLKDRYAIEAIEKLDARGLEQAIRTHRISMCGFVPAFMFLNMVDILGIRKATLVDYQTSARVSRDYSRVVGYAGFLFE